MLTSFSKMKTTTKIQLAESILKIIFTMNPRLKEKPEILIKRKNIFWKLDIMEGIDLSILLFGGFELDSMRIYKKLSKVGDIVFFDVGANIGSHSLLLASMSSKNSSIHSFEPTDYAFKKLIKNISLNKKLSSKISPNQVFLSSNNANIPNTIYSSWKLLGREVEKHRLHHGLMKSTNGAKCISMDWYCQHHRLDRVDFIKLDVDGYEFDVLQGAKNLIKLYLPVFLFEYAPYVHQENGNNPKDILNFFKDYNYKIFYANNLKEINNFNINIRKGESKNLIAIHPNNTLNLVC
jgi:FkbM family methyltransferase